MSLKKPTVVLFDMDGTTVRHINPLLLGIMEHIDDAMFRTTEWMHRKKNHPDFTIDKVKKPRLLAHRAIHKMRWKDIGEIVQPCPGIYSLLEMFHKAKIPMGIVSNGLGSGYGHDILEKFELSKYFSAQVFREDITRSKPAPDSLLLALHNLGKKLTKQDIVWYIGDRRKDVIAALAANEAIEAEVLPFSYGLTAPMTILEKGLSPEHIIVNYTNFATKIYPLLQEQQETENQNS